MPHGRLAALATTAVAVICATPLAGIAGAEASAAPSRASATGPVVLEKALLAQMNRVRVAHGRRPLRPLGRLRRAARIQSRYLLSIGDLRHEARDGSPFWTRLVAAGFPRDRRMGENLAMVSGCHRSGARRAVRMWMASPGHRANLLDRHFRYAGVGVAVGRGCSASYFTADYGS